MMKKFKDIVELGINVSKNYIRKAIKYPQHIDIVSDHPRKINSIMLDERHILRVVYKEENDRIIIITFYPAKKGRYYV